VSGLGFTVSTASITYFETREFQRALNGAALLGGKPQKKQTMVRVVLGSLDQPDPFRTLSTTNYGETRLRNCVKYDLGDGWRLVTAQTKKTCIFLYVGDHEDTERSLKNHRGEEIGVKDNRHIRVPGVSSDELPHRDRIVDHHDTPW
jgi:hypothetical protein